MKQDKLYLLQEFLVTQINNLIFYPLALTLVTLLSAFIPPVRTSLLLWMLCGGLLTLLYPVRCRMKKFLPFIAVHIAVIGIVILLCSFYNYIPLAIFQTLDNGVNRFGIIFLISVFSVYSVYLRLHKKTNSEIIPMPFAVGLSAGALFFQHFQGNNEWDSYYKAALIIIFMMYFLYYYLSQYLHFLIVNANSAGVFPEKEIFRSGMRLTFVYTILGTLILFFTSQYTWLNSILNVLRQIISLIMRFLFSIFSFTEARPEEELQIVQQGGGSSELMLPQDGEASPVWVILETTIMIVILLAFLFVLYKLLVAAVAYIKSAMRQKTRTHEEIISGVQDVREKCDTINREKPKRQLQELFYFPAPKERIRRIYKKKALSRKSEKLMFYTAKEMEQEMQTGPFSEIYEKARYSNEPCTAQDVKRMKEFCRSNI